MRKENGAHNRARNIMIKGFGEAPRTRTAKHTMARVSGLMITGIRMPTIGPCTKNSGFDVWRNSGEASDNRGKVLKEMRQGIRVRDEARETTDEGKLKVGNI